tara:strand:+ start:1168 stop:1590 length:423 start_codon:yes stop_codon:yes gene_type:complete
MKAYLSFVRPEDNAYNYYRNIGNFANAVMDSEANEIVCRDFLSSFSYDEVPALMDLILKKMRINSELTIVEPDFYLASKHIYRGDIPVSEINSKLFDSNSLKSILTISDIESLITPSFQVVSKHLDENSCRFVIKVRRSQ